MARIEPRQARTCLECGQPCLVRGPREEFCSTAHRKAWANRRATRGAQLYDLFMAMRYDRAAATDAEAWKVACRLAAEYREEDQAERAGRRSWYGVNSAKSILRRLPYFLATTIIGPRRAKP